MAQQHVTLLTGLGLTPEQAAQLDAIKPEDLAAWKPDELIGTITAGQKNKFLNDAEFLNAIPEDKIPEATRKKYESGQYARFQNELIEVATKKLGLEDSILTPEDRKSIKTLAEKMATSYLAKNNSTEGLQKMQGELQKMTTNLEAKDAEWKTKLETDLAAVNTKAEVRLLKTLTRAELGTLEGIKLNVPPSYLTDPILAEMNAKYTLVINDNDEIICMQKENPKLRAVDSKNKNIEFGPELKALVIAKKLGTEVKDDTTDDGGGKKKVTIDGSGGEPSELPDYISKKVKENS
jgi:hypothetical protein